MRRFIAYLLASLTIFLGIGIAFKPVVTSINADLDFRDGRKITFRLSNRGDEPDPLTEDDEATTYYADIMKARLTAYGVDNYTITTSGADTIKVTLTTASQAECDNVSKLLCTNPKIEICNLPKEDADPAIAEIPVVDTDEYSWHDNKAYLTFNGASTVLVMPIPAAAQKTVEDMFEAAKKYEGGDTPEPEPQSNDDPEPPKQSIVLWMDRGEDDEYANKDNPNVAKKIIYDQFNTSNFYYGENKDAFQITYTPAGTDITSISAAYDQAHLMMDLLNSSETLYDCAAIQTEIVPANVENLLIYGSNVSIAMSATFISILIAFVVISLLLAFFYRLSSVAVISTMAAHTFLTFFIFTLFRPAFNISAMVGLIIVALCALISSITHNNYLKEELYRGRNLKKANYEASKKTTLLTADVSVLMALVGVITYFLGGASISSIGVVLVIGAVLNILINTFILKGMMWLLTNNTNFQDKKNYTLFKVDASKVPDLSKEEKQTYYGPFINKDYTKKKKITGPIALGLTLVSVIGLIAFGATGKIFNTSNYYASSNEVTFSVIKKESSQIHTSIDEIKARLDCIRVNDELRALSYNKDSVSYFEYKIVNGSSADPDIDYYQTYKIEINEKDITSPIYTFVSPTGEISNEMDYLDNVIADAMELYNVEAKTIRVYTNEVYNVPNNVGVVAASTFISIASFALYLLIRRFRASRVLSVVITSSVGATFTLGFIALTRVVATPVLSVAMVLTMALTTLMSLFILHKDKDLIKEERLKDLATRKAVLTKANAMALVPIFAFSIISVYTAINFFGFGHKEFLALFFASALGLALSIMIIFTWFTPMCNFFDEKFSRVKLPKIKLRKKNKVKEKSNTPEEAIFIGIND